MHAAIPVKVYRSHDLLTVAAPMAGLGPDDITVEVTADGNLVLEGRLRPLPKTDDDAFDEGKDVLVDEWMVGPYHRELTLPAPVDGERATVTYGNGVVVVALPLAGRMRPARLTLTPIDATRGERTANPFHPGHRSRPQRRQHGVRSDTRRSG